MSTPHEGYRRTLRVRTPQGDDATLIVTLQRGHRHGRIWLSFGATTQTTVALSAAEVGELTAALHAAAGNNDGVTPSQAAVDAATTALTTADVIRRVLQAAYDIDRGNRRSVGRGLPTQPAPTRKERGSHD